MKKLIKKERLILYIKEVLEFVKKHYLPIILLLLILLQSTQLVFWVVKSDSNPVADEAWHLSNTLFYQNKIFYSDTRTPQEVSGTSFIFYYGFRSYVHPNFFYTVASFFPINYDEILLINILFLIILILSIYGIGKKLFGVKEGLFAAFLISTYPSIVGVSRNYLLDLPLTAMVTLSVFLLLKSNFFKDKLFSILFVVSFILGTLTKKTFIIFLLPLLIYSFIILIKRKSLDKTKKLLFVLGGIILAAFSLDYFMSKTNQTLSQLFPTLLNSFPTLDELKRYLFMLINPQIGFIYTSIFLVGATLFFIKGRKRFLVFCLLLPSVFLIGSGYAFWVRYSLPYLYSFALVSSKGILLINKRTLKKILIGIILLLGLLQFFILTFNLNIFEEDISLTDNLVLLKKEIGPYEFIRNIDVPRTDMRGLLSLITESDTSGSITICNIGESQDVSWTNLVHYAYRYEFPIQVIHGNGCDPTKYFFVVKKWAIDDEGQVNVGPGAVAVRNRQSQEILLENQEDFELIGEFHETHIYKNKKT